MLPPMHAMATRHRKHAVCCSEILLCLVLCATTAAVGTGRHSRLRCTMDGWLIKEGSPSGGARKKGKYPARGSLAGKGTPPLRTVGGSAFAKCPVCDRSVLLSLLQTGGHLFSADCVPAHKHKETEAGEERKEDEGGVCTPGTSTGVGGPDGCRETSMLPESTHHSSEGSGTKAWAELKTWKSSQEETAPWWSVQEQKRWRRDQPRSCSWWEAPDAKQQPGSLPIQVHGFLNRKREGGKRPVCRVPWAANAGAS